MKLHEQLVQLVRTKGYAASTEKAYLMRYHQFVHFTKDRYGKYVHPKELATRDVEAYLSFLSNQKDVAPATQRSALSAIRFLSEEVLGQKLGELNFAAARDRKKIPVVLSFTETKRLLECFSGVARLQSELMYGCGLRISDCMKLRIKDLDLKSKTLNVNQSKGGKSRILMLPSSLLGDLEKQVARTKIVHEQDRNGGGIRVSMPHVLGEKAPAWAASLEWFWLFPAANVSRDPRSGKVLRHHEGVDVYRRKFKMAKSRSGIRKAIVPHSWRHSFATHMLLQGCDVRTLQRLMGHSSLKTTEIYLHVVDAMSKRLASPLDRLSEFAEQEPAENKMVSRTA